MKQDKGTADLMMPFGDWLKFDFCREPQAVFLHKIHEEGLQTYDFTGMIWLGKTQRIHLHPDFNHFCHIKF